MLLLDAIKAMPRPKRARCTTTKAERDHAYYLAHKEQRREQINAWETAHPDNARRRSLAGFWRKKGGELCSKH